MYNLYEWFFYTYCWVVNDRTNTVKIQMRLEVGISQAQTSFISCEPTQSTAHQIYPRLYICLSGLNSLAVSIYQFYWPNNTQPRPHSSKLSAKLDSAAAEIANKIIVYVGPQGWTSILTRPLEPVRRKGRIPLLMQSYKNVKVLYFQLLFKLKQS